MKTQAQVNHGIISCENHNPYYKLVSTTIFNGTAFIELVYGIEGNGSNEGLEFYFKHTKDGHFYTSRRYLTEQVPPKYRSYFESLQSRKELINVGEKAIVKLINQ